ncbi:MAG TPA: EAL domain-containing protein [Blastocatellia bacterium]|nr:EAL domain-containing protein [Blastocatellia bacterium]
MRRTLLDRILAPSGLRILFQPIFKVYGTTLTLHSLECLARGPKDTNIEPASVLFEYVRRKREEVLVDRVCVGAVMREASKLPGEPPLSINVHASTLGRDHRFTDFIVESAASFGISISRLTVEIVEHVTFSDGFVFLNAIEEMRRAGIKIALDDIGLGQSNYRMALYCKPDYFKVDSYFVKGSHNDVYRRGILESVLHLAQKFTANVVVEGVETVEDLATVTELGIDLVQGFLFAPPMPTDELGSSHLLSGHTGLEVSSEQLAFL